jgi:hypothetical protein
MQDLVDLKPFEAANKTSIFALRKGEPTAYPLPVTVWKRKRGVGRIRAEWSLQEVLDRSDRAEVEAVPVDPERPLSSWQTAKPHALRLMERLKGENPYRAYLGIRAEPYGVFWLDLKEVRPDGRLVVANQRGRGKRDVPPVESAIESTLVFPAVSGGHILPFGWQSPFYLLMSQNPATRAPYPESWMIDHVPLTYAYLQQFRSILLSRGSRAVREFAEATEFYAMYGIGPYSVARYRVVWKRMASRLTAAVLSTARTPFGSRPLVSTDTTSFFATGEKEEAHYLCAILNSGIVNQFIKSFSAAGRGFGAPSVMRTLGLPRFDPGNDLHRRLSGLSVEAHRLVSRGQSVDDLRKELESLVGALWSTRS